MPKGEYLQYGGQAVIEGVMMRSPHKWAVACRAPNGKIVLHAEPMEKTWIGKQRWLKAPFLRGTFGILDALTLGTKAMRFASEVQLDDRYASEAAAPDRNGEMAKPDSRDASPNGKEPDVSGVASGDPVAASGGGSNRTLEGSEIVRSSGKANKSLQATIWGTIIVGLALGLLLFSALPNWIAELTARLGIESPTAKNLISEVVKIVIFIGYLAAIGQMREIKEVFKYHGAEHKAINVLEAEQELNMANSRKQTRLHPRCGTSFAIIVLILSLLVFTFVPRYPLGQSAFYGFNVAVRVLVELALIPFIAGIAYEALRIAGRFRDQRWVNVAFAPGLATQYLTTREPRDDQIEVALAALRAVMPDDHASSDTVVSHADEVAVNPA